jgi:hypothetical protein
MVLAATGRYFAQTTEHEGQLAKLQDWLRSSAPGLSSPPDLRATGQMASGRHRATQSAFADGVTRTPQ